MTCDTYHEMREWPDGRHTTAEIRAMYNHVHKCANCRAFLIITMIAHRATMPPEEFEEYIRRGFEMQARVAADPETAY